MPHEAFLAATTPLEIGAVADLYRQAHQLRWRPLRITERSLSTRWGLSGRRVWSLLDELARLGLLEVERGGRRRESRVTVYDPTRTEERPQIAVVKHSDRHSDRQNERGRGEDIADCEAQDEAQSDENPIRPETETRENKSAPAAPDGWEEAARVYREEVRPAMGLRDTQLRRSKGLGQQLSRIVKTHKLDEVLLVLRWLAHCQDDRPGGADFHRQRQSGLETIRRHFDRYLDLAQNPPQQATGPPSPPSLPPPPTDDRSDEERDRATARLRALRDRLSTPAAS